MGQFLSNYIPKLLENEQNISTIVIDNLNNYFSTSNYKFSRDHRSIGINLLNLARKYDINIIYLNNYFYYCETKFLNNRNNINYMDPNDPNNPNNPNNPKYKKREAEYNDLDMSNNEEEEEENTEIEDYYNKEPINYDILAEFCSHILFAEIRKTRLFYGKFGEDDYIEQGNFKVIKSNYKPHKKYLVTINKKDFTYNIENN